MDYKNIEASLDKLVDSIPPTTNAGWERKQDTSDGLRVYEVRLPKVEFQGSRMRPDRIFYNVKTGNTLLSASDGFMPTSNEWIQIGTLYADSPIQKKSGFKGRVEIS